MDQAEMAFVVTRNQCNLKIKTKNKACWEVFIRLLTQCYGRGTSQGSILLGFLKQLEVVCLQWLDRSWSHLRTGGLSGEPLLIVLVLPCGAGTYQSFIILFYFILFIYLPNASHSSGFVFLGETWGRAERCAIHWQIHPSLGLQESTDCEARGWLQMKCSCLVPSN